MQALTLTEVGGLDRLVLQELPAPALTSPHDVRVRIRCAALNRVDLFVTGGLPDLPIASPHVVGSDGAGVVESVGAEVTAVRPGDRVMLNPGVSCGRCAECREDQEPLCADFAILGAPEDEYRQYVTDVRAEYAHVDDAGWKAGRGAFLKRIAAAPRIFRTGIFEGEYAEQARANIAAELERLEGGS